MARTDPRSNYGSTLERFLSKVDMVCGSCWIWRGSKNAVTRYGQFNWDWRVKGAYGNNRPAHRAAYELLVGPIPAGLTIDHLCRNRACVNPKHFDLVTLAVNQARGGWQHKKVDAV